MFVLLKFKFVFLKIFLKTLVCTNRNTNLMNINIHFLKSSYSMLLEVRICVPLGMRIHRINMDMT